MPGPKKTLGKPDDGSPGPLRVRFQVIELAAGDDSVTLDLPEAIPEGMVGKLRINADLFIQAKQRATRRQSPQPGVPVDPPADPDTP